MQNHTQFKKRETGRHDLLFWRAYLEILNERVPLVESWRDGNVTWHPRVVEKLLWYSDIPNTLENRKTAHAWLMDHATVELSKTETLKNNTRGTTPGRKSAVQEADSKTHNVPL